MCIIERMSTHAPTLAKTAPTMLLVDIDEESPELRKPNDIETMAIGKRLAQLRKARGVTQMELAKKLGLSQNAISAYERGVARISAPMLLKLADALGISAEEIIGSKKAKDPGLPSRRILRRAQRIDRLPTRKQEVLLQTIDAFLKAAGA